MEYHETYLAYLPPYGHFKKNLSLVLQILLSKEISDFYERDCIGMKLIELSLPLSANGAPGDIVVTPCGYISY